MVRLSEHGHEVYLGDAVYASFDGWQIWLRTGDGGNQRIALEPAVFAALVEYRKRLYEEINHAKEKSDED